MKKETKDLLIRTLKRRKLSDYSLLIFSIVFFLLDSCRIDWNPKVSLSVLGVSLGIYGIIFLLDLIAEMDHTEKLYREDCIEIIRGAKVEQRISYDEVGAIIIAPHSVPGSYRSAIDFKRNCIEAAIAVHLRSSKILSYMNPRTKIGTDRITINDALDAFIFNPYVLRDLIEKTGCGLYITRETFDAYEEDLSYIIHFYRHRILVCCGTEKQPAFYTYEDYKLLYPKRTLLDKKPRDFR